MSYLLFIIALYAFFHLYFQNVLVPGMLASQKLKLSALEDQVELLKSKNSISYSLYVGLKLLFQTSESIIDSPNGVDVFSFENRNKEKEQLTREIMINAPMDNFSFLIKKARNPEISNILYHWKKCMEEAYKINFYAWYAYLFPVVIFDRLFGIFNHRAFDAWLLNIQPYKKVTSMI